MKTLKIFVAAVSTLIVLYGCDQDSSEPTGGALPEAEEAYVTSKTFGEYELHFNAISTDQLQPEIARAYNIARSKNRALLNVSILKSMGELSGRPVAGTVSVKTANLTGQSKDMTLKQIREGEAIYYLGDVAVANGETLVFDIEAIPENGSGPLTVRFVRQFYAN